MQPCIALSCYIFNFNHLFDHLSTLLCYICREISFTLNFECNVSQYLDQGIRLEIRRSAGNSNWQPVRFYAVNTNETAGSVVRRIENNMVVADALLYSSNFPLEVIAGNQSVSIREYICDSAFTEENVSVRWLQRYSEVPVVEEAAWSLDDVVLTVWNGDCRREVLRNSFNQNNL